MRENARNLLLEGLKASSRGALMADSEQVVLRAGEPLQERGLPMSHAYFPVRGTVSSSVDGGLDLGLVGFEGMVGLGLALNSPAMELFTRVHSDGLAWRVSATKFVEHLSGQPALRARMNQYALVQMLQLAQDVSCRSHHSIEQRLARQLLKAGDHARSDQLSLTHRHWRACWGYVGPASR